MREQLAQRTPIPLRSSATVEGSLQHGQTVPPASPHSVGHYAGLHPEDQPVQSDAVRRRGLPPPRRTDDADHSSQRPPRSAIRWQSSANVPVPHAGPSRPRQQWHPLVRLGLTGMAIIACTAALLIFPPAVGHWLDDRQYGFPRTYQVDAVVGHGDSAAHPSHFIALNLHGQLEVIELPGGNPSKAMIYVGPMLYGPGQDEVPLTVSFEDRKHDHEPDLVLHFEGQQVVFLNDGKTFQVRQP